MLRHNGKKVFNKKLNYFSISSVNCAVIFEELVVDFGMPMQRSFASVMSLEHLYTWGSGEE